MINIIKHSHFALFAMAILLSCIALPVKARIIIDSLSTSESEVWDGINDIAIISNFCIRTNTTLETDYQIRTDARATGNVFELRNFGLSLAYNMDFRQSASFYTTVEGIWYFDNAYQLNGLNCADVQLRWFFTKQDLSSLPPGDYTGRVWFKAKPETRNSRRDRVGIELSVTVPSFVQITGLEDMDLGNDPANFTRDQDFCVYANGGGFSIEASADGEASFVMRDAANTLPYTVTVKDSPSGGSLSDDLDHASISAIGWIGSAEQDCGSVENMNIAITADPTFAGVGNYNGTLLLTVRPD